MLFFITIVHVKSFNLIEKEQKAWPTNRRIHLASNALGLNNIHDKFQTSSTNIVGASSGKRRTKGRMDVRSQPLKPWKVCESTYKIFFFNSVFQKENTSHFWNLLNLFYISHSLLFFHKNVFLILLTCLRHMKYKIKYICFKKIRDIKKCEVTIFTTILEDF